jgi:hypothetical protein
MSPTIMKTPAHRYFLFCVIFIFLLYSR